MILDIVDEQTRRLNSALIAVDNQISNIISALAADKAGKLLSDDESLAKAVNTRAEIINAFTAYNIEAQSIPALSEPIKAEAIASLGKFGDSVKFSDSSSRIIKDMLFSARSEITSASFSTANEISNMVYNAVLTNLDKAELTKQAKQQLIGQQDRAGKPMKNHAETIIETRLMQIYASSQLEIGKEAGVKKWKYRGTLVRDSREWCVGKLGKVFTREEIDAFDNDTWAGKAPGNTFTSRGGWRCRHTWQPYFDN